MGKPNSNQMHPRNIFINRPDFTSLAIKYEDFRKVCTLELNGEVRIDFKNENALRTLTMMLLKEYFQLDVEFAPGSLVPTVPLRLNYILWIEDLLNSLESKPSIVKGIDIGCGSSSVYSLLCAKKNNWEMYGLEEKAINIEYAQKNVKNNNLQDLVKIFHQKDRNVIFDDFFTSLSIDGAASTFQFTICNPPFFNSLEDDPFQGKTRNINKRTPPHNAKTGALEELTYPGGEVEFVKRIFTESSKHSKRVCIFTSMLGHKASLNTIVEFLKDQNIADYGTTEFHQGNTTRWAVAWTFIDHVNLSQRSTKEIVT